MWYARNAHQGLGINEHSERLAMLAPLNAGMSEVSRVSRGFHLLYRSRTRTPLRSYVQQLYCSYSLVLATSILFVIQS